MFDFLAGLVAPPLLKAFVLGVVCGAVLVMLF